MPSFAISNSRKVQRDSTYIRKAATEALGQLLITDWILVAIGVGERSVCHKYAIQLGRWFDKYSVDCEYDLKGLRRKRDANSFVTPDIIVHHRLRQENLLAVEAKKQGSREKEIYRDSGRLDYFCKSKDFTYLVGLQLVIEDRKSHILRSKTLQIECVWYTNERRADTTILERKLSKRMLELIKARPDGHWRDLPRITIA